MSEQNVTLVLSNKFTAYICTYMKYDNIMYAFNLTFKVYDNRKIFSKVNNNCILLVKMNIIFLSCFFCISRFKWSHKILRSYYAMGLSSVRLLRVLRETKGVIIIRKSKNRQHNGQKKMYKRTNNDIQNIHIKLKIE